MGRQKVALGLEHLLREGGSAAGIGSGTRRGRSNQQFLGVIHLRIAEIHHPLLDLVKLGLGSQFADIVSDIVGDVILKRHQCTSLTLVTDESGAVIIPFRPADEGQFAREGQGVAGSAAREVKRFAPGRWSARVQIILDVEHSLQGIRLHRNLPERIHDLSPSIHQVQSGRQGRLHPKGIGFIEIGRQQIHPTHR